MVTSFTPWDLPLPCASNHSNLQYFLQCITPIVPTRLLPNQASNGFLQTHDEAEKDIVEGFTLRDLWHSYTEWSAYGASVPIVLNNGDHVVQYYTPSLSALQIYTRKPLSSPRSVFDQIDEKFWGLAHRAEQGNGSFYNYRGRDKINKSSSNVSCLSPNTTWYNSTTFPFGSCCTQTANQCGYLYYQYNEMASPYDRLPLIVKIKELAKHYPGLVDLCSTDLSPYSWMAIAWYPVYQIPTVRNAKELSACFLTYHPLSSLSQGSKNIMSEKEKLQGKSCSGEISLPPFAVVTYKMSGTLWINPETSDQDIIICQRTAACYWLKQLQFQHHDFNFFMSRQFQNYQCSP
ncbi:hypothetical protein PTKIN_Ptkin02bG0139900 [Pterospermum kingtungense]